MYHTILCVLYIHISIHLILKNNISLDFLVGKSVKKVNGILDTIDIDGSRLNTNEIKKIKEIINIISEKAHK